MVFNFDEDIIREHTDCIKYDLREKIFGTKVLQPMWVADMDFASPPFIKDAIVKRAEHPIYGYTFRSKGFYDAVAGWMHRRFNWRVKNEWISFSSGIVPAVNLCIQKLTQPGEGIIVQSPVYSPFFSAIKNNNRKLLNNQLIENHNKYTIDFDDFEKKAREASLFILCHPHNPVGRIWNETELKNLVDICIRYKVLIISDEIHHDLVLNGHRHLPLPYVSEEAAEISICCISPSKTFNLAGLSTSALVIPNKTLKKQYDDALDACHTGMGNIFGLVALKAAYNHGDEWLDQLLEYLWGNLTLMEDFINQHMPEIHLTKPEATYLGWLDFRDLRIDRDMLWKFLISEAGLGLNDGNTFGPGGAGFQRINFALPAKKLEEALSRLEKAVHNIPARYTI